MKVKLEQLVMSVEPLQKLFTLELPIRTTFRLKKITQEIDTNLKTYEESRTSLLEKYGVKNEHGFFDIPDDKQEKVEEEHRELLNEEINLGFTPLSVEAFENVSMSSRDLLLLDWLIVE